MHVKLNVYLHTEVQSINDLIYGYGGQVIQKNLLEVEEFKVDMTTSIGAKFVLQI